jgi:hypothetical protein
MAIFSAGTSNAADIQDAFMDIEWGASASAVKNLKEIRQASDVTYYVRPNQEFAINKINLGQPILGFFNDKFFAAFINIASDEHVDAVKNFLDRDYGPVRAQLRVTQTIYIYDYHDIKIKLKQFENKGTFKLAFYYTPLSTELNESRMEKNFERTRRLVPKKEKTGSSIFNFPSLKQ